MTPKLISASRDIVFVDVWCADDNHMIFWTFFSWEKCVRYKISCAEPVNDAFKKLWLWIRILW